MLWMSFMTFAGLKPPPVIRSREDQDQPGSEDREPVEVESIDESRGPGRVLRSVNFVVFIASVLVTAIVLGYFAAQPRLRWTADATNTRAYSLSEQSERLLDDLEGDWTISLVLIESQLDDDERKQINEVLGRYTRRAPNIAVEYIDPTDPSTLDDYEALLARLRDLYAEPLAEYDVAIEKARGSYLGLVDFANQHVGPWTAVLRDIPQGTEGLSNFQQYIGLFDIMARDGMQVLDEVDRTCTISASQPIADVDAARSILATALTQWANTCDDVIVTMERMLDAPQITAEARAFLLNEMDACDALAQTLMVDADVLVRLPSLELANIGRKLSEGEAAVVIGPQRATVIPRSQLLPRVARRGVASFDRRFRGEQLISSTIRSLLVDHMPMVVFVHAEPESLLKSTENQVDLLGVATSLAVSRFEVREWGTARGDEQPTPEPEQDAIWIIIPPAANALETSREEQALISVTERLIRQGESVLMSFKPSFLPRYQQRDPWSGVAELLGVSAETQHTIYETFDAGDAAGATVSPGQVIHEFLDDHPVCAAVHGQQMYLFQPVPLAAGGSTAETSPWSSTQLAAVEPNGNRWLESDLISQLDAIRPPIREERLDESRAVALALHRADPASGSMQRAIAVGSGSWMFSRFADSVESIGGGQVALLNPGNQEFLLASVSWLGGLDDMIAPSPISQQVSRLDGINGTVWMSWFLLIGVAFPFGWILLGGLVTLGRRI